MRYGFGGRRPRRLVRRDGVLIVEHVAERLYVLQRRVDVRGEGGAQLEGFRSRAFSAHALFLCAQLWCNYAFPILLMGEWSTLLLNIRVIYRLLGRTEMLVSASFAITFFLTRIVFFGLLVLQLYSQFFQLKKLLSTPLLISYLGLLPAVYGLNWVRA